jgi:hypothetical protein
MPPCVLVVVVVASLATLEAACRGVRVVLVARGSSTRISNGVDAYNSGLEWTRMVRVTRIVSKMLDEVNMYPLQRSSLGPPAAAASASGDVQSERLGKSGSESRSQSRRSADVTGTCRWLLGVALA